MKIITKIFLTLLLFSCVLKAQTNLVPNPSFESRIGCPTMLGDFKASNWWASSQTPDYYNPCASYSTCVSAPNTGQGIVHAFNGSSYSAICTIDYGVSSNYREYISAQLTTTLVIGTKYYFSMEVLRKEGLYPFYGVCSSSSNGATNKIGALFTTNLYDASHVLNPKNYAQVYESNIITDTTNWTQIKGSFIADSVYQYINLGNFFDDNHTDTVRSVIFSNNPSTCQAYYFIDEIILSTDSTLLGIKQNATNEDLVLFPNPITANFFYIKSVAPLVANTIRVFNQLGIQIKIKSYNEVNNLLKIVIDTEMEKGVYYIDIITSEKINHFTIIKN